MFSTITLSNGVPNETVSSMLGHTNIRMTEHYVKIITSKVARDMEKLKNLLDNKALQEDDSFGFCNNV